MSVHFQHLLADPIEFVAAGSVEFTEHQKRIQTPVTISGVDARKIYEDILREESESTYDQEADRKGCTVELKRKNDNSALQLYTDKDLYRASQIGDLEAVKECICGGKLDVNSTDSFLWTPLMIAAYEGHSDVVLFLLSKGAQWLDKIDGSGYDARELACLGGHPEISDLLMNSEKHIRSANVLTLRKKAEMHIKREKIWCDTCKSHYYASPKSGPNNSHITSTVHLFSDKDFPPRCHSHFYIPSSNKGFQLLQRGGWNGESGLGPKEDGFKYPVKTVLKRDKLGIGSRGSTKAKVTHFKSFDENAIKSQGPRVTSKSKRKRYSVKKAEQERKREIQFRRLFH